MMMMTTTTTMMMMMMMVVMVVVVDQISFHDLCKIIIIITITIIISQYDIYLHFMKKINAVIVI